MNATLRLVRIRALALPVLLGVLLPGVAAAEKYRVDVIVFADRSLPASESPQPPTQPDLARTFEPWEVAPLRNAGIEILEDELFGLMNEWKRLSNSRNHEPLVRLAWLQKDPPAERGVAIRLRNGKALVGMTPAGNAEFYPVDGWVSLLAGRYLHLDTSFVVTEPREDGQLVSYRLRERRRLRRDELHHLDSPRLGLIVRATRAEQPPPAKAPRVEREVAPAATLPAFLVTPPQSSDAPPPLSKDLN